MNTQNIPTTTIELPSRGIPYAEDHPLSDGTIEIRYMTAADEDVLTDRNLIRKGTFVDKLYERVVVEEGVDPDEVLVGDKSAVLLATRILAYGADYEITVRDPYTQMNKKVMIDLSEISPVELDWDNMNQGQTEFEFELPVSKSLVTWRLMKSSDQKVIQRQQRKFQQHDGEDYVQPTVTTRLRHLISSVDGDDNLNTIRNFVNNLIAADSFALRKEIRKYTPDLDMTFEHEASDGSIVDTNITLDADFFLPST